MWKNSIGVACCTLVTGVLGAAATASFAGDKCVPVWDGTAGTISGSYVSDFILWDAGAGEALYAVGSYGSAGGTPGTSEIAQWTGSGWEALGNGLSGGYTNLMESFQGDLYAGGYFDSASGAPGSSKIAKWDGKAWSGVDSQMSHFLNSVWALKAWDDGNGDALFVGGNFVEAGGTGAQHIAKWDGSDWSIVGGPVGGAGIPLIVLVLETWDDGTGEALYMGGRFSTVNGVSANRMARWNGTAWTPLGTGITGPSAGTGVHTMEVFDDGTGEALYVGGHSFDDAGGVPVLRVARWDGTAWSAVGDGFNSTVDDLEVFDDGTGPALYAIGNFTASGATPLNYLAKWNGTSWEAVDTGLDDNGFALYTTPGDDGNEVLNIGGTFAMAGDASASRVAQLIGCPETSSIPGDVNGDGVVNTTDLLAILDAWGPCEDPPVGCYGDLNDDGEVDVTDLLIVIGNWTL